MTRYKFNRINRCVFVVALSLAHAGAFAENSESPEDPSIYRLNLVNQDTYRLVKPYMPIPIAPVPIAPVVTTSPLAGKPFAEEIHRAAREMGLDPALVHAVIYVESRYNPLARSPAGAVGLMQVMPATAARYGISNPAGSMWANLLAGTRYLQDLMLQFNNNLDLVLAAYNAGENAVRRYGQRIPPYRETQLYVPSVLTKYREWQAHLPPVAIVPTMTEEKSHLRDARLNQYFLDQALSNSATSY